MTQPTISALLGHQPIKLAPRIGVGAEDTPSRMSRVHPGEPVTEVAYRMRVTGEKLQQQQQRSRATVCFLTYACWPVEPLDTRTDVRDQRYQVRVCMRAYTTRKNMQQPARRLAERQEGRVKRGWRDTLLRDNCSENMYASCGVTVPRRLWMTPPV